MKRICYKVLLTLVMLLGAIGAQAQTTGKVYVMDDFSEDAIAGAQVRISLDGEVLAEGVTDEEGCYDYELNPALESVTPCMLSVTADGYLSYEKSVRIDPAAASYERVFDVYLVENKAILSVTVTDTPNGEKIEGATVRLLCDGEAIAEAVTNKNGKCTVKAAEVKEGAKYVVSAEAPDYNPAETEVVPVMGETVDCSVKMSLTTPATTGRIFVYIKDDEWGERVTGALVKLSRNGETVCEGTTDDNGRFAFKIVPALTEAETFTVNVTAENYLPYDGEITVNPAASLSDRTYDIDLALANPITELDVWVGDAVEEKEIAGANVRLSCNGELI